MSIKPPYHEGTIQSSAQALSVHAQQEQDAPSQLSSMVRQLQNALWEGAAITSILWNYRTKDWATNVHAEDIDNDGDIEILFSARDGTVRAHTPWGAKKWDKKWDDQYISALCTIPVTGVKLYKKVAQKQACVIVGMRSGDVYALDQNGKVLPEWHYNTGRMIRHIYVDKSEPNSIFIGSEDCYVHVIDRVSGKALWEPFETNGWVRSIFGCDLDNDQRTEILAGSGDGHLYILDMRGQLLEKLYLGHQIYALFAAPLGAGEAMTVITSSNHRELFAWTIARQPDGRWELRKKWEKSSRNELLNSRIHTIFVEDVNNDQQQEILLGSEDGYLYILDAQGALLWKRRFGSCVYSIWSSDINYDGQKEILVGTEDSGVYTVQIELSSNIYTRIKEIYDHVVNDGQIASRNELLKALTPREKVILKDFIDEFPVQRHVQMEVEQAFGLMQEGYYEQALSLLLRVRQQHVQYCWPHPATMHGYIWTLGVGEIEQEGKYDLLVGTDEGYIYAIDTNEGPQHTLWMKDVAKRARMLQCVKFQSDELASIIAVLGDDHIALFDHEGKQIRDYVVPDKGNWIRIMNVHTRQTDAGAVHEILVGLSNNAIMIWDAHMEQLQQVINSPEAPQSISMLASHDFIAPGSAEIVACYMTGHVCVYRRSGGLLWSFCANDRIQALRIADIDRDGLPEVIVGSEDRNVYVLNHEGNVKWRFRAMRGILDVVICDLKLSDDPEESSVRKLKVLVSSADGCLNVLTAFGDRIWKYRGNTSRIRVIRALDMNNDGMVELAMASENQLELLQIPHLDQLYETIQDCWRKWMERSEDRHAAIMAQTYHPDEFIRAFALAMLAGQHQRYDDDIKRFQEVLRTDDSQEVKKELARAIVLFLRVPTHKEENTRQARIFLRQLSADPDPDIRLAIVDILPLVLEIDEALCFEYLDYFTYNVDIWVRRAVVRKLDSLVKKYPERVFTLLLTNIHDEEEWIRQEIGRVLSHYFDAHPAFVIRDSMLLLAERIEVAVLEQIAYTARKPAIKRWFHCLVQLLTTLDKQTVASLLDEAVSSIRDIQQYAPIHGDDYYQVYSEFYRLLQIRSSSEIARYQWVNTAQESEEDESYKIIKTCMGILDDFGEIAHIIRGFERREAVRDRVTSLINATDKIEVIRNEIQQEELHHKHAHGYDLPEFTLFSILLEQQYQIIKAEIYRLRGNARLVTEIRNKEVLREEQVVVSLLITNKGISVADNIRVAIVESAADFLVIGTKEYTLLQLPTGEDVSVEFKITPLITAPRLRFHITYDDAEKRNKQDDFADVIILQDRQQPYQEIPNPYTSGTPIRDRKMFYGRRNDIDTLCEKLSSVASNKVVVLSGQRRMGKTSLIYQLADELMNGPQVPVLIDLQGQALQTMGQLFAGLALRIREEVQRRRQIQLSLPDRDAFLANPTESFDAFLAEALQKLNNEKLILLLDEFEVLQDKINNGPLNQDVLHYLRSLMQHRQGLNFLLVGAPRIRHVTEPSWSIFFNIALHHGLRKLEAGEAAALITEPIKGFLEYDMLALERMHRLSGNLPYFIHVFSEILIAHCNRQHKSYVTVNDINTVLDTVLEEQAGSINWIWQASSPLERFLLAVLAQDKGEDGRIFTLSDIYTEFDAQGVPYEQDKVTRALQDLVREDIIEEFGNGVRYRLPVGLVKEWLRKIKPPERVIRDEFPYDED